METGILPLELRREELSIRQAIKIMMKDRSQLIKMTWDRWRESEKRETRLSPFGKMSIHLADMTSNTDIKLNNLEKEFTYTECIQPSKAHPEYWRNIGSSKSRTTEQEIMSRKIITDAIQACGADTTICFTIGSCMGNAGPCGTISCISFPGSEEPVFLKKSVTKCGSLNANTQSVKSQKTEKMNFY